jgi:hypothetical protein
MITAQEARQVYERSYTKQELDETVNFIMQELDKKVREAAETGHTSLEILKGDSALQQALFEGLIDKIDGTKKAIDSSAIKAEVRCKLMSAGYLCGFQIEPLYRLFIEW